MIQTHHLSALLDSVDSGLLVLNSDKIIIYWNRWLDRHGTVDHQQAMMCSFGDVFPEIVKGRIDEAIEQVLTRGYPSVVSNVFNRTPFPFYPNATQPHQKSLERIQQAIYVTPLILETTTGEKETCCLIQITDVTAAVTREKALEVQVAERREAERLLDQERSLFVAGPSVIFKWQATDGLPVEYVSPNVENQLGYTARQFTEQKISFLDLIHPADLGAVVNEIRSFSSCKVPHFEQEFRIVNRAGEYRWFHEIMIIVRDSNDAITHYHGYVQDIHERKVAEAEVERLAYHDALTDLPNRRLMMEHLQRQVMQSKRSNVFGALLFMDLDNFKSFNDSLGHRIGDAILVETARRIRDNLRTDDIVARIGGDEFVIIVSQLGHDREKALTRVRSIGETIRRALNAPCCLHDNDILISPSIGIRLFPDGNSDADSIINNADTAMYDAKKSGRNSISFYQPEMQQAVDKRIDLERGLEDAIQKGEMTLHLQPQNNIDGKIVAAECLLRWDQPGRGLILPDEFIPIAEDRGLICDIGDWMIETACEELIRWQNAGLDDLDYLAVNISPKQFRQKDFADKIIDLITRKKVSPRQLVLELTERLLISDIENAIIIMQRLKNFGVRFAIDDFGTGYSSLAYLSRLPIDILKIDQCFIHDINDNKDNESIVHAIMSMAKHMKLTVIAEGVETSGELKLLNTIGCQIYQGFYFYQPNSIDDFIKVASANNNQQAQNQPALDPHLSITSSAK